MDASTVKQTQGRNIFPRVTEDIRDSEQQLIIGAERWPQALSNYM
jgi:hypothetical protein